MKMYNTNNSRAETSGIGFFGLLQLAFIILKVTNLITWSWWLVFLPFWLYLSLLIVVVLIMFYFYRK